MKLHYYIPFGIIYCLIKILVLFTGEPENPKIRWVKYFGTGFTQENYCRFMDDMVSEDPSTYWVILIGLNGAALILLIIALISKVG